MGYVIMPYMDGLGRIMSHFLRVLEVGSRFLHLQHSVRTQAATSSKGTRYQTGPTTETSSELSWELPASTGIVVEPKDFSLRISRLNSGCLVLIMVEKKRR